MPHVDILQYPDWDNLSEEQRGWIYEDPRYPGMRFFRNESTERLSRAILAAETVMRAGGSVSEEGRAYNLPALVDGLAVVEMGKEAWMDLLGAANWATCFNRDASINLDHPDVKAVL